MEDGGVHFFIHSLLFIFCGTFTSLVTYPWEGAFMKCGLCGREFDEQKTEAGCQGCPLHQKDCGLVKCPYCQFEMPLEPKWFNSISRKKDILENTEKIPASTFPLHSLEVGHAARVVFLDTGDSKKAQNLMAMGVFPGSLLTLIQKFPCYVFQLGHSQFAIDHELAKSIFVYPPG